MKAANTLTVLLMCLLLAQISLTEVPLNKRVAIRSKSSNKYLNGRNSNGENVVMSDGKPYINKNLQWTIQKRGDFYFIKSVSSKCYLDATDKGFGADAVVSCR